jgi:hypothetical protein
MDATKDKHSSFLIGVFIGIIIGFVIASFYFFVKFCELCQSWIFMPR